MLPKIKPLEQMEYKDEQQLHILMTLIAQDASSDTETPCPSDEQLAAFIDKQLDADERQAVLEHLNFCPSCYQQWLDISEILAEEEITKPSRRYHKLECLSSVFAIALAACLIFLILLPPSLSIQINASYQVILKEENAFELGNTAENIILPWKTPTHTYGFGGSNRYAPSYRAFGAGLWKGKQELTQKSDSVLMPEFLSPSWQDEADIGKRDNWSETPWNIYFSIGRWCFLVRTVCLSDTDMSPIFWEQQQFILEKMQKDFAKYAEVTGEDARIINERLEKMKSVLKNMGKDSPDRRERRKIASELGVLIAYLSPNRMPLR